MDELGETSRGFDNKKIFDRITTNPWDEEIFRRLSTQAVKEIFRSPTSWAPEPDFYNCISGDSLVNLARSMRNTSSLEEKYHLLAEEASYEQAYAKWYRRHHYGEEPLPLTWYDVIQGRVYNVRPPKKDKDPFAEYPESVMDALSKSIGQYSWGRAIDLGSGTGDTAKAIGKSATSIISIDRFDFLHEVARRKAKNKQDTSYVVADAAEILPLRSGGADLIVSNGLTAFLPKDRLDLFSQEIARVLEEGGSYFEPLMMEPLSEIVKTEYLSSAKGLLAYMVGELVTSPGEGLSGAYPHSVEETDGSYKRAGLSLIVHRFDSGAVVCEYFKAPATLKDELGKSFQKGDGMEGNKAVSKYLLDGKDDVNKRFRAVGKLAQLLLRSLHHIDVRQGGFDGELYVRAFIQPLAEMIDSPDLTSKEKDQLKRTYSNNLMILRRYKDDQNPSMQKGLEVLAMAYQKMKENSDWVQEAYLTKITLPDRLR